ALSRSALRRPGLRADGALHDAAAQKRRSENNARALRHPARAELRAQSRNRAGRVRNLAPDPARPLAEGEALPGKVTGRNIEAAKTGERKVFFGKEHGALTTQIYNRDLFEPGHKLTGPAIVEQLDTTTV